MERRPVIHLRQTRIEWPSEDRWPVRWTVELGYNGRVYRLTGTLILRARPLPPRLRTAADVMIVPKALEVYRRDWTRWVPLVPSRHASVTTGVIRHLRGCIDARYAREVAA